MPEHPVGVSGVELDQLGKRARMIAVERGKIRVQVVFELMPEGEELGFGDLVRAGQLDLVNNLSAVRAEHAHRVFEQRSGRGDRLRRALPPDADPGACQRGRVQEPRVVGRLAAGLARGLVRLVGARQYAEQRGSVGHHARHRSGRILLGRDRDDSGPADQAERRLDPDDAAGVCRAHDRAVSLGPHGKRREPGCDGDRRA